MPVKRSKEKEPAIPRQIDDLKKLYSDRLSFNLSRANATLITWVSALFLILITTLLPLSADLRTKFEHKAAVAKDKQQLEAEEDERNQIESEQNPDIMPAPSSVSSKNEGNSSQTRPKSTAGNQNAALRAAKDLENQLEEQNRDVAREKNDVAASSEQLAKIKNEMAEIPLPFGKLPIRKIYSPVLWAALFLFIRIRIFSMLARIIDIHRVSGKLPEEFEGLGTGIPFWLAPLPKFVKKDASDDVVSRGDLEHFLGWKVDSKRNSALTIACLFIGFVLSGCVVFGLYRGLAQAWSDSPKIGVALLIATSSLCLIALFSAVFWLAPRIELRGFSTRVMGRRNFIVAAGAVLVISGALLFTPEKYLYRSLLKRIPRFRRRQKHVFGKEFRNKFWRPAHRNGSVQGRLVYYIGSTGFSSHVFEFVNRRKDNEKYISDFKNGAEIPREEIIGKILALVGPLPQNSPGDLPAFRVRPRQFSAVVECLSLEQVKAGNTDLAMKILWAAISGDNQVHHPGYRHLAKHPDYRLYDLLAGLAFKYSNEGYKQNMVRHIEQNWDTDTPLAARAKKWSNPSERWTSKWAAGQPLNWKHPFVNWKDAARPLNSAYAEYLI
jgi:hypothetical protein